MATLSQRHPCARRSLQKRPANAFRACIEEGLREYEEDKRTAEREQRARMRMRSLREVYAFHLDMLRLALSARPLPDDRTAPPFGRIPRGRHATPVLRYGNMPMPEA